MVKRVRKKITNRKGVNVKLDKLKKNQQKESGYQTDLTDLN